jgi:transcription elongation factor GreA
MRSSETSTVEPGARVVVEFPGGDRRVLTILGPSEVDAARGVISTRSPVGQALRGHRAGEQVEVRAPGGCYRLKILTVESA